MTGHKLRIGRGYSMRNGNCIDIIADLGGGLFRGSLDHGRTYVIYREDGTTLVDGWRDHDIHWPPEWKTETERHDETLREHASSIHDLRRNAEADDTILAAHHARLTAVETALARIEDLLAAEQVELLDRVRKLESQTYEQQKTNYGRKSLGWLNFYEVGKGMSFHVTRATADDAATNRDCHRLACIEIFEGEGL